MKLIGQILCAILLGALTATVGVRAVADSGSPPPSASLDSARRQMERGQDLYAQQRYAEAADAFAAAYAAEPYAAFLYNEAVCHQKLGNLDRALALFRKYLAADPNAPDAEQTRARIARIEASIAASAQRPDAAEPSEAGPPDASADAAPAVVDDPVDMKSLVIIESDPTNAPVSVFRKTSPSTGPFSANSPNPGWVRVTSGSTPLTTTLDIGSYHIVIDAFADYHRSEADMEVAAGHIHQFKAILRQGEFLAFLRVTSPQSGARIYLDDPPPHRRPPWGTAPHEGLVGVGQHRIWVERSGFEPVSRTFTVTHGEQRELLVELQRAPSGMLVITGNDAAIEIEIDGRRIGMANADNPLQIELPAGSHDVVASASGRKTVHARVDVPKGRMLPVDAMLMLRTPRGAAWTQAVLSAALLGGGLFLGSRSNAIYDDLQEDRRAGRLTDEDDRYGKGKVYAIGADLCFGVSGLLAALSTWNFVKETTPSSSLALGAPRDLPDAPTSRPAERPQSRPTAPSARESSPQPPTSGMPRLLPIVVPASARVTIEWRF